MTPTLGFEDVEAQLLAADAAGIAAPADVISAFVFYVEDFYGLSPQVNAALHRQPAFEEIRDAIRQALARREEKLVDSTPAAFAEYVASSALDDQFVEGLVRNARWALDHKDLFSSYQTLSSMCESALGGSSYVCTLLDRVLADLATHPLFATHPVGAQLRLFFRRVRFMALRGTARPLELVLPGDDIQWVDSVKDAIGYRTELLGLSDEERARLIEAWSAVDWDGTLGIDDAFECEVARASIEDRPWSELADLVSKTSFHRLEQGEKGNRTMSRVFARGESLDARIALADSLVAFASAHRAAGKDARSIVVAAITAHLDGRKLTGALGKALKKPAAKTAKQSQRAAD